MTTPVSFKIAKLLKEKGFDEKCDDYYVPNGELYSNGWGEEIYQQGFHSAEINLFKFDYSDFNKRQKESYVLVPTIAEVVMWSFNTHKIWITVDVNINGKFNYLLRQFNPKDRAWEVKNPSSIQEYFNNPDDAYSSGIIYFLNNLEMSK